MLNSGLWILQEVVSGVMARVGMTIRFVIGLYFVGWTALPKESPHFGF